MKVPYDLHVVPGQTEAVIVLPGSSGGIKQSLVRGVFDLAAERGFTVATFDYPYHLRGEKVPPEGLLEEIRELASLTDELHDFGVRRLHIIGKSLGAVVSSRMLATNIDSDSGAWSSIDDVTFTALGFVAPEINYDGLQGRQVLIIQGEHDRFAKVVEIQAQLDRHKIKGAKVVEIAGATHSFRDAETDTKPIHEAEAIAAIEWLRQQ